MQRAGSIRTMPSARARAARRRLERGPAPVLVTAAPLRLADDAVLVAGAHGLLAATPRAGLWRAQTPQGFALDAIRAAHAAGADAQAADDVELARAAGIDVAIVEGHEDNIKITTPYDLELADFFLSKGK